jgi:hypothetical protein
MRRWQHKVVIQKIRASAGTPELYEDPERERLLDEYGQDGWELVSVVLQSYRRESDPLILYGCTFLSYYFKKEIPFASGTKPVQSKMERSRS